MMPWIEDTVRKISVGMQIALGKSHVAVEYEGRYHVIESQVVDADVIHANSPRLCGSLLDTTPVVSHTGHHISRIKSSFELICVLVWDLAHF